MVKGEPFPQFKRNFLFSHSDHVSACTEQLVVRDGWGTCAVISCRTKSTSTNCLWLTFSESMVELVCRAPEDPKYCLL